MLLSFLATASALPWPQGDVQQDRWAIQFLIRHDDVGSKPATLLSEIGAADVGEAKPEAGIEHQVDWARAPAATFALDMQHQDVWGADYSAKGRELIAGKKVVDVLLFRMDDRDRNASFRKSLDLVARYAKRVPSPTRWASRPSS